MLAPRGVLDHEDQIGRSENPFQVIKNLFRHDKVRCKGLTKNTAQIVRLFGLANLVIAER